MTTYILVIAVFVAIGFLGATVYDLRNQIINLKENLHDLEIKLMKKR